MANVKRWSYSSTIIQFKKEGFYFENKIFVDSAIMDDDVQCFHCGKNIKAGKLVFCGSSYISNPFEKGDEDWGDGSSYKRTFCSSNHAKLFAKNNNGID
jgi:hypothetical protein